MNRSDSKITLFFNNLSSSAFSQPAKYLSKKHRYKLVNHSNNKLNKPINR